MIKTSILIPARGETYENLSRTVRSIYENATGEFEVIIGYDGTPAHKLPNYPNLKIVEFPQTVGIKININALASMAKGKYIYKSDAHCAFGKGFNEILSNDMQDDWIMMPRFYVLDGKTWEWQDDRFYDYFYLCCPFTDKKGFRFKAGGHWPERTKERDPKDIYPGKIIPVNDVHDFDGTTSLLIDETPQIHGSGWMMTRDYFFNKLGGFPNVDPHGHAQEPIWLALKTWLGGGKVMVNKKTWYAHLHQQGNKRGYHMDKAQEKISYDIAANYWMRNSWAERKHNIEDFIEKFMPMPTWPENWRELFEDWRKNG